ncbi:hypothetical protein FA95DRAFT_1611033, partial [Auriscalpium vulgare]
MDHARTRRQDENTDPAFWMPKLQLMPQIYAPLHPHRLWHPTFDGIGVHNIPNIGQATTTLEGAVTLSPTHLHRPPLTQDPAYTLHPADVGDRSSGGFSTMFAGSSEDTHNVQNPHNLLQSTGHSGQMDPREPITAAGRPRSLQYNRVEHFMGMTGLNQPATISNVVAPHRAGVDPRSLDASNYLAPQARRSQLVAATQRSSRRAQPYSIGRPSTTTVESVGAPSRSQCTAIDLTTGNGFQEVGSLQLNDIQLRM